MAQLGTFSEASLIRLAPESSLKAAALISCGLSTGYGSVVERAAVKPGETVVVIGCGGIGSGAIQGARLGGARTIVAVDPVAFKTTTARGLGATHTASSVSEALQILPDLTEGRMADVVVLTPSVLTGDLPASAQTLTSKDGRIVLTAIAPMAQRKVDLDIFQLAMYNQALLGTVFGSASPRVQVPNLLRLFEAGQLKIDELVTREYAVDEVQQGYDDLHAGRNIRGLVAF